jgi:hypothetical protein
MKLISGKPLSIKWPLILTVIFYGLYFSIGGDLWGTLGLLFLLVLVALSIIRLANKFRNRLIKK